MAPEKAEALDKFGKMVVTEVFDRSCGFLQGVISHGMRGGKPDPLHLAYQALDEASASVVRWFLMEAVDQTFAQFLNFLDVHEIPIVIKTESGGSVDVRAVSDGLAAEPYSESGWIANFSKFKDGIPLAG